MAGTQWQTRTCGLLAAGAGLAASELPNAMSAELPSLVGSVGQWVDMISDAAGQVSFRHGTFAITGGAYGAPNTVVGPADAGSSFKPDGTIKIVLARSKVGNPAVGAPLTGFLIRVRVAPAGVISKPPLPVL